MPQTQERHLEDAIEAALLAENSGAPYAPGGYRKRTSADYDRALCLDGEMVIHFLYTTQPQTWERLRQYHGDEVKPRFLRRLAGEIDRRGTLDVLRKGVTDSGCRFDMAYFQPSSGLNPELRERYRQNIFSVVRQLAYSEKNRNTLDLTIFLNGLPLFTAELKNHFTGQNVNDAMRQYRQDRDPREPLFQPGRCLAHFAVDPELVFITTQLQGDNTRFLPFNKGYNLGAGNPPHYERLATSYLWDEIWSRDSILNLIQHFIHELPPERNGAGRKRNGEGKRGRLIFPRYHQLDAVRRLVAAAREQGAGHRYLIQHSAGSGKSNTIAWLAHQLSILHDDNDERVFDSIVIVTDRRVLDRQLQNTVRQFEQTIGVVENIDQTSRQLREALESGKAIIVTTLQKFPQIVEDIGRLQGNRFAVIIDEAHSSSSGSSVTSMKRVLSNATLESAAAEEALPGDDLEDRIAEITRARGHQPNLSMFAFTATPKPKTLELFGTPDSQSRYQAFSLYSMRQAIEEGFIMDVLENYTTYKTYWNLVKRIEEDPEYDRDQASYVLRNYAELHEHAIQQKLEIMLDHFYHHVFHRIGGRAKAMIVTRSRLHAVRYRLAADKLIKEKQYPFKALVAFSGTVEDMGISYTEVGMNGFPDAQTAANFERDEYRIMIVAEKFQTGFDQPLLHTMYVDKLLRGVHAVQTLSRLNRIHPDKRETMVLDFANEAADIQAAFEPFYERTILSETTDPNLLYDHQYDLDNFGVYSQDDVDRVAYLAMVRTRENPAYEALNAALAPVIERFRSLDKDEQDEFRAKLDDFVRIYAFLSQIIRFQDTSLEKLFQFGRLLNARLHPDESTLPTEIVEQISMDSYLIDRTYQGSLSLAGGVAEVPPAYSAGGWASREEQEEPLSAIIRDLNDRFGTNFPEEAKIFLDDLEKRLDTNESLRNAVKANPPENSRITFEQFARDKVQEMMDVNFDFYKQINDNPRFANQLLSYLFERYQERIAGH